jgi:subtilisin family serine protease
MKLNYTLFQGASVQLHNLVDAKRIANDLAKLPVVKGMWPVKMRQSAKPHVEWQGTVGQSYTLYNQKRGRKSDEFPPHVMTQVDKLRDEGYTGQGIKIAVVDSGVRKTRLMLLLSLVAY